MSEQKETNKSSNQNANALDTKPNDNNAANQTEKEKVKSNNRSQKRGIKDKFGDSKLGKKINNVKNSKIGKVAKAGKAGINTARAAGEVLENDPCGHFLKLFSKK